MSYVRVVAAVTLTPVVVLYGLWSWGHEDCVRRGVSPDGREERCRVDGRTRTIVDAGHVARTPAYSAELLDSWNQRRPTATVFPEHDPERWPAAVTVWR